MRLKTKLVIAITVMVVALVTGLSYVYVSQLVRERIADAADSGDFVAHQIYNGAREALEIDLSSTRFDPDDANSVHEAIAESLQSDPGLNTLLQSIVGYSPVIYDAAITDNDGVALLATDAFAQGKPMRTRPDFSVVQRKPLWRQIRDLYGPQQVFDVTLPLSRENKPFGEIRVGIQTVFLKNELKPQLNRTFEFAAISIVLSFLLAAALSNFALRPLEAINRRLDLLSSGEEVETAAQRPARRDEYGIVSTKIDRLGQQMRDVKEVFSALKENLDQIMGNLQDGLMLFTHDARVVLVSASAERFVGHPRADLLGRQITEIFTVDTRLGRLILDCFELRQSISGREIETDSGARVQVSLDFIEERGQKIGALLTIRDAESVRRIEDEIELSRRLAAIGRLTSGVAHEVKNPINAIMVHLQILREKLQEMDPGSRRHMDVITSEIQRLDRVVQTLVDFTRPVDLRLADQDMRRIAEDVLLLASPEAERHGVRIASEIADEALPVKIDADLVKQALLNIVLNGVQAMANGGTLTVRASRHDPEVLLEVVDEGGGIPPEIRDKIFNLYFTTKKGGSGIGLAMTYRVMQLHNGSVEFETQADRGTTFRLHLPLTFAQEPPRTELATQPEER